MAKKAGEIVNVKSEKGLTRGRQQPKVLGAAEAKSPEQVETLDRHSPVQPQEIVIRTHNEVVTIRSQVRSKPLRPDEPDVRVRTMTPEAQAEWERAKRAED